MSDFLKKTIKWTEARKPKRLLDLCFALELTEEAGSRKQKARKLTGRSSSLSNVSVHRSTLSCTDGPKAALETHPV